MKQKSMAHSKKKKSTEPVPGKDPMADLLGKHFKGTVLKMPERKMWRKSRKQCTNKTKIPIKR